MEFEDELGVEQNDLVLEMVMVALVLEANISVLVVLVVELDSESLKYQYQYHYHYQKISLFLPHWLLPVLVVKLFVVVVLVYLVHWLLDQTLRAKLHRLLLDVQ